MSTLCISCRWQFCRKEPTPLVIALSLLFIEHKTLLFTTFMRGIYIKRTKSVKERQQELEVRFSETCTWSRNLIKIKKSQRLTGRLRYGRANTLSRLKYSTKSNLDRCLNICRYGSNYTQRVLLIWLRAFFHICIGYFLRPSHLVT